MGLQNFMYIIGINFLFIFLVLGTTYVYLSKNLASTKKMTLMFIKLILLLTYLLVSYTKTKKVNSRFVVFKNKPSNLDKLIQGEEFKFLMKSSNGKTISLHENFQTKKGLKIYFHQNQEEMQLLIHALAKKSSFEVLNLKYLNQKDNWKKDYVNIMQKIKQELVSHMGKHSRTIMFYDLPLELLQNEFIDLLIMFENSFKDHNFIILENKPQNIEFIKKKYRYLSIYELKEIEPEMFKSILIKMTLDSPFNRITDVQAAHNADEYYKKNGASLKSLFEFNKKINPPIKTNQIIQQ